MATRSTSTKSRRGAQPERPRRASNITVGYEVYDHAYEKWVTVESARTDGVWRLLDYTNGGGHQLHVSEQILSRRAV